MQRLCFPGTNCQAAFSITISILNGFFNVSRKLCNIFFASYRFSLLMQLLMAFNFGSLTPPFFIFLIVIQFGCIFCCRQNQSYSLLVLATTFSGIISYLLLLFLKLIVDNTRLLLATIISNNWCRFSKSSISNARLRLL